jgi:hypothetical protein
MHNRHDDLTPEHSQLAARSKQTPRHCDDGLITPLYN